MTFSMTTDYSKIEDQSFEALPTNSYEALIENVQERATKNGAESLQIKLRIRNDLDAALPETNGKKEKNTYNGETTDVNRIAPWNFKKTQYPQVNHKWKETPTNPTQDSGQPIDVSDEDLPF